MLTPYDFGRETGRLQAQIHTEMDINRAYKLIDLLGIVERPEFTEGYRNGFTEGKKPNWLPDEQELAEAEREMLKMDESLKAAGINEAFYL